MILFIILSVILLVLISVGLYITYSSQSSSWKDTDSVRIEINDSVFLATVAASASKQRIGLSSYTSLQENEGMLFVFATAERRMFWMKGMNFPIDIIWIQDGTIVDITHDLQAPSHTIDIKTARPQSPASFVLELAAGSATQHNLSIGDPVRITKLEESK